MDRGERRRDGDEEERKEEKVQVKEKVEPLSLGKINEKSGKLG